MLLFVAILLPPAMNEVGILAAVAWALLDENKKLVHQEEFFVAATEQLVGTIGGMKETINENIIRRVVETTLKLSKSDRGGNVESVRPPNTYESYEEAIRSLPPYMVSTGPIGIPWAWARARIEWDWAKLPDKFNWDEYLRRKTEQEDES